RASSCYRRRDERGRDMTDKAFREGIAAMLVAFPDREKSPNELALRSQVYRRVLDHLTDEAFLYAVSEALRYERWFPVPSMLIDYSDDYVSNKALPEPRTPEQLEESRERARENVK